MVLARQAATPPLLALAFAAGVLPVFLLAFVAWPEIVTPAWFVARGYRLYDAIFFPHTPLLILLTAAAGKLVGFSAPTFRAVAGLASGATVALLVAAARSRGTRLLALLAGAPLFVLLSVSLEGPALWPEPFLAPFALAGALLLERFERRGDGPDVVAGGLVLGVGILVKQTFAWFGLAALLWLLLASRRRSWRSAAVLVAAVVAPYGLFALLWGAAFGTLGHLRWTLFHVVLGNHAGEIGQAPEGVLRKSVAPFLVLPALALLRWAVPGRRLRSPVAPLALGAFAMAWPRLGLLHLAAAAGLLALAGLRSLAVARLLARLFRRRGTSLGRAVAAAVGVGLVATYLGVTVVGGGRCLARAAGGPTFFWNDRLTSRQVTLARERTRPGGPLFVFEAPHQTLFPLTGTVTPNGFYVNPSFWYYLNKDGLDARLVASLEGRRDVPILFAEPPRGRDGDAVRQTAIYRFLVEETRVEGQVDGRTSWRRVR